MVSKTDNDLAPMIYRYYRTLQDRVTGSEEELDRRFDKIIETVEQRNAQHSGSKFATVPLMSRASGIVHNVRTSALGRIGTSGACAALAAKLTQYAQGWANLAATVATGALTAVAVAAVMDTRSFKRLGRARHQEEATTSAPHP
ncbi:hypothetical protein [Streptomyces sp. P9-2]|uniref:hypothetical protein n=1 Tax=Streptomyces sp. P9-2 TaxID=3423201 RepID=UPI003F748A78